KANASSRTAKRTAGSWHHRACPGGRMIGSQYGLFITKAAAGLVPAGPRLMTWLTNRRPAGTSPAAAHAGKQPDLAVNHRSTGTSPVESTAEIAHGDREHAEIVHG